MDESLKFYDAFGDMLKILEDENSNIVDVVIIEDADDKSNCNKVSFILDKEQALKLANFFIEKFSNPNI